MWLFTNRAFFSIVKHSEKPGVLLVRSRFPGHIEKVFPKAHITEFSGTDYQYRTELNQMEVSRVIAKLVSQIDYDNFKNSLDMNDEKYFASCIRVYDSVLLNSETNFTQFKHLREEPNEG